MTTMQIFWLASLFIASITINASLYRLIMDDKLVRPNSVALIINTALSLVGSVFLVIMVFEPLVIALFVSFNGICFFALFTLMRARDIRGLEYGEKLLSTLNVIDLQVSFILTALNSEKSKHESQQYIDRTLRYILTTLPDILGLDSAQHPEICLLIPKDDRFKVAAYLGIEAYRINAIETLFRFGAEPVSVAGVAMTQRRAVIINDLTNIVDPNINYWVATIPGDIKSGSLLAFPIMSGLSTLDSPPIAVLYISTRRKNAFQNDSLFAVLNQFVAKIEILLTILELSTKSQQNSVQGRIGDSI